MMIDTHCHIDQFPSPESLVQECETEGIRTIAVTNLPSHFMMALPHLKEMRFVTPALGMHPMSAKNGFRELGEFRRLAREANFIGEIGLDFSPAGKETRSIQEQVFEDVLGAISDRSRFVTLHSRGAETEVIAALKRNRVHGAVFHWFSGSDSRHAAAISNGHFMSFNAAMIRTVKGKRLLAATPLDRILVESDGPFARVSGSPASPLGIGCVYQEVANTFRMESEETAFQIAANFNLACGNNLPSDKLVSGKQSLFPT